MAVPVSSTVDAERAAIVATVLDYFEGWFDGDAGRMERALHPGLAKRSLGQVASAGAELRGVTKEQMVTWTAEGEGKAVDPGPGRRIDVSVVDVYGNIASAVVDSDVLPRVPSSRRDGRRLEDRQRAMALDVAPLASSRGRATQTSRATSSATAFGVFYEVYGSGEPTVLLLPTWSIIHSRHWKMQIPYLARHCRVLTFDGRGNGRSDRPESGYDEREFAADALAVLDATATDSAVLVSLSLGAQRALMLAAEHPERVDGAVFICPAVPIGEPVPDRKLYPWDAELDTDEGWAKYNRHYWLRDYRGFLEFFFSRMFTEPHSTKPIEDCVGWGLETTPETLVAAQVPKLLARGEARKLAGSLHCPVLVIHGEVAIARPGRGSARGARGARRAGGRLGARAARARPGEGERADREFWTRCGSVLLPRSRDHHARAPPTRRASSSATASASSTGATDGPTEGPAVAAVGDLLSRLWKGEIPFLARHGRVVTFDRRGNSRSDRSHCTEAYTMHEFAADTLAVIRRDRDGTRRGFGHVVRCRLLEALSSPRSIRSASRGPAFIGPAVPLSAATAPSATVYPFNQRFGAPTKRWAKSNMHH